MEITSHSLCVYSLSLGRHNLTVRAMDTADNVAGTFSWIFSIDACTSAGTCVASAPHMAPVRQCENGYYLDLLDDNICKECTGVLGCTRDRVHCTNRIDSVCGDCSSGFSSPDGRNFYDCEFVSFWPSV